MLISPARVVVFLPLLFLSSAFSQARQTELEPPVVLLMSPAQCCSKIAWPDAEEMIRNELQLHQLSVTLIDVDSSEGLTREALEETAASHRAAAAISIFRSPTSSEVELWIIDRLSGKATFRTWENAQPDRPDAPIIAAARTVEALRASLLETRMKKKRDPPRATPQP